jgi:hypothetical protein
MAVIELAKPGQEATTYELIVTVGNAALLVNGVVSTQLLTPFRGVACDDDDNTSGCGDNTVDTDSPSTFKDSGGPWRFTQYTLVLQSISIASVFIFARFLPRSKQMCRDWKEEGERLGTSDLRGKVTLAMVVITLLVSASTELPLRMLLLFCEPALILVPLHSRTFAVRHHRRHSTAGREHLLPARSGWLRLRVD